MPRLNPPIMKASVPVWEYITDDLSNVDGETLGMFGAQGWELCGIVPQQNGGATLYFKRPIVKEANE